MFEKYKDLQLCLFSKIKEALLQLTFDDLSQNAKELASLGTTINNVTGDSKYKIYSVGQKEKSDFLKNYEPKDFEKFWKNQSPFILIPGFINFDIDVTDTIKEAVFGEKDSVCSFIKEESNCKPSLHYGILDSILKNEFEKNIKQIAKFFPTLSIFKITNAASNKPETVNYKSLTNLKNEKLIFTTPKNPSDKNTAFFLYAKLLKIENIYHINSQTRETAGFTDNEIPSSDDPQSILQSFKNLEYWNLDYNTEYITDFMEKVFTELFTIPEEDKDFYRFLLSGFDKTLTNEPIVFFEDGVHDVWKEVYKNIEPSSGKFSTAVKEYAKKQIKKNSEILNITYLTEEKCKDKLRTYSLNNSLYFFKYTEFFNHPDAQKDLFTVFIGEDKELYQKIPLQTDASSGELTDATGNAYLNPDSISFPDGCNPNIKLIRISDNKILKDKQEIFIKKLDVEKAVIEALSCKKPDSDISKWIFDQMRNGDKSWKDIFETKDGEHNYYYWIPLKNSDDRKRFCAVQDILSDSIFSADTRDWISANYGMYNSKDLAISNDDFKLLKSKKIIAATIAEQYHFLKRKVSEKLSFKLDYPDQLSFFTDCTILDGFESEPVYSLINKLKSERKNQNEELFEFYESLNVTKQDINTDQIYIHLLNYIADTQKVNEQTILLYKKVLERLLQSGFRSSDVNKIKFPTQADKWKSAAEVSSSKASSITTEFLLNPEIYDLLKDKSVIKENNYTSSDEENGIEQVLTHSSDTEEIKKAFKKWEGCLEKKNLLYLFFYLLKGTFKTIAEEKLSPNDLLPLTHDLKYEERKKTDLWNHDYNKKQAVEDDRNIEGWHGSFSLKLKIPKGKETYVFSLAGKQLKVNIRINNEIYTEEPFYYSSNNTVIISLINTSEKVDKLDDKLKNLILLLWQKCYFQRGGNEFRNMIENFTHSNQNTIKAAQEYIFDGIIQRLKDLNLQNKEFKKIHEEYKSLINEQVRNGNDDTSKKNILAQKLIDLLTADTKEARCLIDDIFKCVVTKIEQSQYNQRRILFELLQNADDALNDLFENDREEVTGRTLFDISQSISPDGRPVITVSHFGRKINESLSNENDDKYSNDLLNMLLINSSDKTGADTGKFGLGFKSVYLICTTPELHSGDLHFKILGALYPENIEPIKLNDNETRIILTLNDKADIDEIFTDFEKCADMQSLFCKQIKEITTRGKTYKPVLVNEEKIKNDAIAIYSMTKYRVICITLKSAQIIFKLAKDEKTVESFGDSGIYRVWNLTPLCTSRTLPFAINAKFEVDQGRSNLASDNRKNEGLCTTIAKEFSSFISDIHKNKESPFKMFISSILDLLLKAAGIQDGELFKEMAKSFLQSVCADIKIIPNGIGGIITNPTDVRYMAPTTFNFDQDSESFKSFMSCLQETFDKQKLNISLVTKNVYDSLTEGKDLQNEVLTWKGNIGDMNRILELLCNNRHLDSETAEKFRIICEKLPQGRLPSQFEWKNYSVKDENGQWKTIVYCINSGFDNSYSQEVISFFEHTTSACDLRNGNVNTAVPSANYNQNAPGYKTVKEIFDAWVKADADGTWTGKVEEYYNQIFPEEVRDKNRRREALNIPYEYFTNYDINNPTMPKTWCILFLLGILQSKVYWNHSITTRCNRIKELDSLISEFVNGKNLQDIYDLFLADSFYDEEDLPEFESLLRVYKFRKVFMDVYSLFKTVPNSKYVSIEQLLTSAASSDSSGTGLSTYASQTSLKLGISMIVRELLDCNFYGDTATEKERAFKLLNKFTYMPNMHLRQIVYQREEPTAATSEEIYVNIKRELQDEDSATVNRFLHCHDLPFILLG